EVGVETFILKSGNGPELHVPVTYRGAPLDAGDAHLIGTMDHSVLGKRWMYDAAGDPVYAQTLASTILSGGSEVEQYVEKDGQRKIIPGTAHVSGSGNTADSQPLPHSLSTATTGSTTTIKSDTHTLVVLRRIGDTIPNRLEHTLHGTWAAHDTP